MCDRVGGGGGLRYGWLRCGGAGADGRRSINPLRNGVRTKSPASHNPGAAPPTAGRFPLDPGGNVGAVASIRCCRCSTRAAYTSGHSPASSAHIRAVAASASGADQA